MPTKYSVTALDRRGIGHPNCWRAGRSWPSGQEVIVEVLDQDEDPMLETKDDEGDVHRYPDPVNLGRNSLAVIRDDKRLMVRPVGNAPEEAETLQATIANLQASFAGAVTRAELAEREVVRIKAESEEHATQRVAWMDAANKYFAEGESLKAEIARLNAKVLDLDEQLDQATSPAVPVGPDHAAAPSVDLPLDVPAVPATHKKHHRQ